MILITGGAGYIGSHVNKLLNKMGFKTIIFDNLSTGNCESLKWGDFFEGDLNDKDTLSEVFKIYPINAVIHLAASAYVGESVHEPRKYYANNVVGSLNLLDAMIHHSCVNLVFSSSCATYGDPHYIPIDENHPQNPVNPYGASKLMVERIIADYSVSYDLKCVTLRYFNASGADPDVEIGEYHDPETHLLPLVIEAAHRNSILNVFGSDYATPDGTAVRDYIHVSDLAEAHIAALSHLERGGDSNVFNLGNGNGFSIFEVIDAVERITGKKVLTKIANRRLGDPAVLVGDSRKAKNILGWQPAYTSLDQIVKSACSWHSKGGW